MASKSDSNVFTVLKNIYRNEYHWSIVKSVGLFAIGVKIAQECAGMEIMPSI